MRCQLRVFFNPTKIGYQFGIQMYRHTSSYMYILINLWIYMYIFGISDNHITMYIYIYKIGGRYWIISIYTESIKTSDISLSIDVNEIINTCIHIV